MYELIYVFCGDEVKKTYTFDEYEKVVDDYNKLKPIVDEIKVVRIDK